MERNPRGGGRGDRCAGEVIGRTGLGHRQNAAGGQKAKSALVKKKGKSNSRLDWVRTWDLFGCNFLVRR